MKHHQHRKRHKPRRKRGLSLTCEALGWLLHLRDARSQTTSMDLIGVEPTTSSMPWNSRSLVLMRGMGSPVIEPVYIANVDEVNRGQRRPKGSEWGQRAKVWAFSPSTGPS